MAELGILAFKGIQELDFAMNYGLSINYNREEGKAEKKEKVMGRKLRLKEIRLRATESDNLGEMVKRTA